MTELPAALEKIDGDWIADLTEEMVKIPSVTLEETEICAFYERQLVDLGLEVDILINNAGYGFGGTIHEQRHKMTTYPRGGAAAIWYFSRRIMRTS